MKSMRFLRASMAALAIASGGVALNMSAHAEESTPKATTANPNPSASERTAASVTNELDKAMGPTKPITKAELESAIPLSRVDDPAKALSTAEIKNPQGQAVGTVSSVDVKPDGKASAIHANVGGFLGIGDRVVALDASKLVYLKSRNLLVTQLSKAEIEALPPEDAPHG